MTSDQIVNALISLLPILVGGGGLAAGIKLLAEARRINAETTGVEVEVQKRVKAIYEELDTARREEIQRLRVELATVRAECAENKTIMQGEIRQLTSENHNLQTKFNAINLENMDLRRQLENLREQLHAFQETVDHYAARTADDLANRNLPAH